MRKDNVHYHMVTLSVSLAQIREGSLVSRKDRELVNLFQAGLGLDVIRSSSSGHGLDVRSEIQVVLTLGLVLSRLYLGTNRVIPLGIGVLLRLLYPVRAIDGILVGGELCGRRVDVLLEAIGIWLDLLHMGSQVGLVIRVKVRCHVRTCL